VSLRTVETEQDQCPECRLALEIAAVRFSFFQRPATLLVCPNCALMRADCPAPMRVRVSDWIGAQIRKKSISAGREVAAPDRNSSRPTGGRMGRGAPATPLTKS